jgi:membrane protein
LVGFCATVLITTLALLIVYTSVPNASVQIVSASAGAAFAALLWEASKWAFTSYIEYSTTYARLYGVLALLPLFLLWVYVTWIIVLLGFQVTAILQRYRQVSREGFKESVLIALGLVEDPEDAKRTGLCLVDPASVLLVMAVATDHFVRGLPASSRDIADQTGLDEVVVADLLGRLAGLTLLHRVAPVAGERTELKMGFLAQAAPGERFTLARPPEAISAAEVLRVGESFTARDASRPAPILEAIREAKMRALDGKSLADIHAMLTRREALLA